MKSRYQIEHCDGTTFIRAQGHDPQMPTLEAIVMPYGNQYIIYIAVGGELTATTNIWRGKAFATRVAKFMLKGFLSRLGRHRRATQNRAAKRAKAQEAI